MVLARQRQREAPLYAPTLCCTEDTCPAPPLLAQRPVLGSFSVPWGLSPASCLYQLAEEALTTPQPWVTACYTPRPLQYPAPKPGPQTRALRPIGKSGFLVAVQVSHSSLTCEMQMIMPIRSTTPLFLLLKIQIWDQLSHAA